MMPLSTKLFAKLSKVVDLTVENQPNRLVFVAHGLPARRGKVDDREPAVAESNPRTGPHALIVRSSMADAFAHGSHHRLIDRSSIVIDNSRNPTHDTDIMSLSAVVRVAVPDGEVFSKIPALLSVLTDCNPQKPPGSLLAYDGRPHDLRALRGIGRISFLLLQSVEPIR